MIYKFKKETIGISIEVDGIKKSWSGYFIAFCAVINLTSFSVRISKPGFSRRCNKTNDIIFVNDVNVTSSTVDEICNLIRDSVFLNNSPITYTTTGSGNAKTFEFYGITAAKTGAQNKTAMQTAIDDLSSSGGGILLGLKNYALDGPIVMKHNVKIQGVGEGDTKGSFGRGGSWFIITDTVNSIFTLGSSTNGIAGGAIQKFGFDYPGQPMTSVTPASSLIQYPAAIVGGANTFQCLFKDLSFVGAWKMIEIDGANADNRFERIGGYPLSGRGIYIKTCLDINRITECIFSPSSGNYFRVPGSVASMVHSPEVVAYVMSQPNSFIEWEDTDEFYSSGNFGFAYPTFFKVVNSYGSSYQDHCDIGRVGFDLNAMLGQKAVSIFGSSLIGSGGPVVGDRNHVVVRGTGTYNLFGLNTKLGISSIAGISSTPDQNAFLKVENVGTPRINIYGATGKAYAGSYARDIDNLNPTAVLNVNGLDFPDAVLKWNGVRLEENITASLKGVRIPAKAGVGVRAAAFAANGDLILLSEPAVEVVLFDANFVGDAGTLLNAYTPEVGSFAGFSATVALDGAGKLNMTVGENVFVSLPAGERVRIEHYFDVDGSDIIRSICYRVGGGHCLAQVNKDPASNNGEMYVSDSVGGTLASSGSISLVGATKLTVEINGTSFIASIDNAANSAITGVISGTYSSAQIDAAQGGHTITRLTVTDVP